ncbi:MAG: hypothetical protein JWN14_4102 [Chthonomonadales bacterium]|nr:hypothetical protein [Chthonomonadales bacterium]
MSKLNLKSLVPICCFGLLPTLGGTQEGQRLNKNITNLDVVKHSFHVIIKTGSMNVPNVLSESWYGNGCSHAKVTTNTVDHIVLMRVFDKQGKEFRCPVSAWSDLGKINEVNVVPQKDGGCKIVVEGGDGGLGYEAVLSFSKGRLTRRKVSDGVGDGTDKDAFETTAYTHN